MATVLDVGLLQNFDVIFSFLIVFSITYAILLKTKLVSESMGINAIIAISASFLVILSDTLVAMINFMLPWFVVIIIFLLLMILVFKTFDPNLDLSSAVSNPTLKWTLIGVCLVLIGAAFANTLGQSLLEATGSTNNAVNVSDSSVQSGNFEGNLMNTIFHPKVLGIIILFGVAIFAIAFLSGSSS